MWLLDKKEERPTRTSIFNSIAGPSVGQKLFLCTLDPDNDKLFFSSIITFHITLCTHNHHSGHNTHWSVQNSFGLALLEVGQNKKICLFVKCNFSNPVQKILVEFRMILEFRRTKGPDSRYLISRNNIFCKIGTFWPLWNTYETRRYCHHQVRNKKKICCDM